MTQWFRPVVFVTLAAALSACGIFSRDTSEQPAELQDFDAQFDMQTEWRVNIGDGQGRHFNRLTPAIDGDTIYAAAANGEVAAINKRTGERRWRSRTGESIRGAVGANQGLVLFGTRDAEVVALDQLSGEEQWRARVSSEVLSAPRTDGRVVVLQTVDGRLYALEASNGQQRWVYESTVPALSLRGSSSPLLSGNLVVAGFANGLVAALDVNNGFLQWEERVAIPQGRSDLQRVVDVDGDPMVSGGTVYVAAYQGNVMGLDLQSGNIVWGREASSYHGLASGLGNLYYVDDNSHIVAASNSSDAVVWENDDLRLRQLTAPTTTGNFLVVGDFEGYVHVLSQVNGQFVSRQRVGRSGIRGGILAEGNVIYVYTNSGRLAALRFQR